ncbi:MFS transporter [Spelaeicoccus albus]|uniref:MFS family permease n=1 Tax=Spelaeicoccus albus TaxID=1280376 RepID=A0A7Z0A9B1_9MICO|nr:MFS transporter [Spelaeicoccus albus]NYI66707.1 MFS family permease [Spelaeicoccus albus]
MAETSPSHKARRAAIAGFLGSTLEYYDFFIYGSAAALFFDKLFFPDTGTVSALISLATLGVAYVARPFGAVLWGHLGDKLSRRDVLVLTLVMMGGSTFLIGCLPTYGQIGVAAPILLVVLRLIQGLSAGGESPGSSSLTVEHAPERLRAFFTSFTLSGVQFGIVISSAVFVPISKLPDDVLLSWGWRIPFLLSAVITFVAYFVRRKLSDAEVFEEIKDEGQTARMPVVDLLIHDWANVIRVTICALFTMVSTVFTVFALSFAVGVVKLDESDMLIMIGVVNLITVVTQPAFAYLSDRVGRKPVFIVGCVGCGASVFAFFGGIATGNWPVIYGAGILMNGIFYAMPNAVYPAYFPELFPVQRRYTGMAICLMLGLLMAGFSPAIGSWLTGGDAAHWGPIAWLTAGVCLLSAVAAATARETFRVPTERLGLPAVSSSVE